MNWDDLKVLLALSRAGSTRKAAATLGVSNTTVMRRLESLEQQVGGPPLRSNTGWIQGDTAGGPAASYCE